MTSAYMFDEPGHTAAKLSVAKPYFGRIVLTVDSAGLVVAVPRPTIALPNSVLDPLLRVLVKAIGDILLGYPRFDVVTLHLLDDLNAVLGHAQQRSGH